MSLKQIFYNLISKYSTDIGLNETFWQEIESNYSDKKRYYHTLRHIQNLFSQLSFIKSQIDDWDTLLFSIFYHDIIYNVKSQKNEALSAALALERLNEINYPNDKIQKCYEQIMATKSHQKTLINDTNLFTDADLSILGTDWKTYLNYTKQIRKEYAVYPKFIYNPGRKKVIKHFLSMEKIFKTKTFHNQFEIQARQNLNKELNFMN